MSEPRNTLSDGVISLAPVEPRDALTLMELDADREVQRWFDWPLTPSAADPGTYAVRLASAEQTVRNQLAGWEGGTQFVFIIRSVEANEGIGWIDLQPRGSGRGNVAYGVIA
jgi:hypothetical protein